MLIADFNTYTPALSHQLSFEEDFFLKNIYKTNTTMLHLLLLLSTYEDPWSKTNSTQDRPTLSIN
jgi:hypothetical protein